MNRTSKLLVGLIAALSLVGMAGPAVASPASDTVSATRWCC